MIQSSTPAKRFGSWELVCGLVFGTLLLGTLIHQSYRSLIVQTANNEIWYLSLFWGFVFMLFLVGFTFLLDRNGFLTPKQPATHSVDPNFYIVRSYRIVQDDDGGVYRFDLNEDEIKIAVHKKVGEKPYKWQRLPDVVIAHFSVPGTTMHICDTIIEDPNQIRAVQPYSPEAKP